MPFVLRKTIWKSWSAMQRHPIFAMAIAALCARTLALALFSWVIQASPDPEARELLLLDAPTLFVFWLLAPLLGDCGCVHGPSDVRFWIIGGVVWFGLGAFAGHLLDRFVRWAWVRF